MANGDPSAFKFCTMPSTLLELNSLRQKPKWLLRDVSVSHCFQAEQTTLNIDYPPTCRCQTSVVPRQMTSQSQGSTAGRWKGSPPLTAGKVRSECSDLVLEQPQDLRDVFCRGRLQVHQRLLQVLNLWHSANLAVFK